MVRHQQKVLTQDKRVPLVEHHRKEFEQQREEIAQVRRILAHQIELIQQTVQLLDLFLLRKPVERVIERILRIVALPPKVLLLSVVGVFVLVQKPRIRFIAILHSLYGHPLNDLIVDCLGEVIGRYAGLIALSIAPQRSIGQIRISVNSMILLFPFSINWNGRRRFCRILYLFCCYRCSIVAAAWQRRTWLLLIPNPFLSMEILLSLLQR